MEMKIMWAAAIFFGGWLWFYLFVRQVCINFFTVFPLIKKMRKTQTDLIAPTANGYTAISIFVSLLIICGIAFVVIRFAKLYLLISFFVGALLALVMYAGKLSPNTRSNFESFCVNYYRFVPDDELRTAMYNKKIPQMKLRLHDMNLSTDFIPKEFK